MARTVRDTWLALQLFFGLLLLYLLALFLIGSVSSRFLPVALLLVGVIGLPHALLTFSAYLRGIAFDESDNTLTFPASDVENSVASILTLRRWRQLAARESVSLDDIDGVYLETQTIKGNKRIYANLTGAFGSRQLEFSSRQKRDEFRSMLQRVQKNRGKALQRDAVMHD